MLPLTLDLSRLRLALIGAGPAASQRLERLDAAGATNVAVYAPDPSLALAALAGQRLTARIPDDSDLARVQIAFIAGLDATDATEIAERARAAGVIVHVEDTPTASDIQMPAVLTRGDLTIAVSTGGQSPALAAEIKRALGRVFGPEWATRLDETAAARDGWRSAGLDPATVRQRTSGWLTERGWLDSGADFESHWDHGTASNPARRRAQQS